MTKQERHVHKYIKTKYVKLDNAKDVTNPKFIRMNKPILRLLVCACGKETGSDLLEQMPKEKE